MLLTSTDPAPWRDKSQMYTSAARPKSLELEFDILEKLHYTLESYNIIVCIPYEVKIHLRINIVYTLQGLDWMEEPNKSFKKTDNTT